MVGSGRVIRHISRCVDVIQLEVRGHVVSQAFHLAVSQVPLGTRADGCHLDHDFLDVSNPRSGYEPALKSQLRSPQTKSEVFSVAFFFSSLRIRPEARCSTVRFCEGMHYLPLDEREAAAEARDDKRFLRAIVVSIAIRYTDRCVRPRRVLGFLEMSDSRLSLAVESEVD